MYHSERSEESPRIVHPSVTKQILKTHGIRLTKRLGQHFLIDENTLKKEVEAAAISKKDTIIEIGPGIGTLTQELAERAGEVIAIEYDNRFVDVLKETLADCRNVEVVHADALKVDLDELLKDRDSAKVVANLPYNIATHVISKILEQTERIPLLIVMIQKEIADRIVAAPGTKEYGFFSVRTLLEADCETVARVPRTVFLPQPNVDSSILKIAKKQKIPGIKKFQADLFDFIKIFFNERRKTVGAIISGRVKEVYGEENRQGLLEEMDRIGVEKSARAGSLTYEQFFSLFRALQPPQA